MTPERWNEVKTILAEVADLQGAEREARLSSACGTDNELRLEVDRLLGLGEEAESFLETTPTLPRLLRIAPDADPVFQENDLASGRFRIVRLIGTGGMAEVYEARDETLPGVRLALKTIRPELGVVGQLKDQFKREVELSRQVTHPNVCRVNEIYTHRWADEPDEALLLSMELLQGETLSAMLRRVGRIGWRAAWPLANQMGQALEAAHRVGVVHRDFKSSNVMLVSAPDGSIRAVVTDFGLAAALGASSLMGTEYPAGGTPGFMSPEQAQGEPTTKASDIFSFGVVLYQMVNGQLPFPPEDWPQSNGQTPKIPPVAPKHSAKDLPHYWRKTILRCLEWNPALRTDSAREVIDALDPEKAFKRRAFMFAGVGSAAAGGTWMALREDFRRVAVVPFRAEPSNPQSQGLADGLAEELIQLLSSVPGLSVIAKTSSFKFPAAGIDVKEAAKQLKADALIGGDVSHGASQVTVDVRMHGSGSSRVLWDEKFEKPVPRVPELPLEIARSVAKRLGFSFNPQRGQLAAPRTLNAEAFNWYILGRKEAQARLEPSLEQSLLYFDKAIAIDPDFALAISEKASSHVMLSKFRSTEDHLRQAEELALKALQLAPDLAEAHLALGATWQKSLKWNAALVEFRKAKDLNPNLSVAHHWLAGLLSNLGANEEALREIEMARNLDPLSVPVNNAFGGLLYQAGFYDRAVAQFELTLSMDRGNAIAYNLLAQACMFAGKQDQAFWAIGEAMRLEPRSPLHLASLAFLEGRAGRVATATSRLREIEALWQREYFSPYFVAQGFMGVGNEQKAMEWLERGMTSKDPSLAILKVDPVFGPVRSHEAFRDLIRRLEL